MNFINTGFINMLGQYLLTSVCLLFINYCYFPIPFDKFKLYKKFNKKKYIYVYKKYISN